ncbi:MAG: hypothetical protein WAU53_02965 [Rhodoplanes sp.]
MTGIIVKVTPDDRRRLEAIVADRSAPQKHVWPEYRGINARCSLRIEADQRVIVVAGLLVHHYRGEDAVAEAYAMKQPGDRAPAAVSRCR